MREESKRPKILLTTSVLFPPAPLKMSETLFENFEKMGKKQNKEQVPPATEPQSKKQSSNKQSKKSQSSNTSTPATHRNLEEAFKSVSNPSSTPCIFLRFYFSVICSFFYFLFFLLPLDKHSAALWHLQTYHMLTPLSPWHNEGVVSLSTRPRLCYSPF